jgi:chromosomal replication initiation ATPase DnaA
MTSKTELAVRFYKEENRLLRYKIVQLNKELQKLKGIEPQKKEPIEKILYKTICEKLSIDIAKKKRNRTLVDARRMYYHWLCRNTSYSLYEISNTLPLRQHHTTIIWMRDSHESLYILDHNYKRTYDEITIELCEKTTQFSEHDNYFNV